MEALPFPPKEENYLKVLRVLEDNETYDTVPDEGLCQIISDCDGRSLSDRFRLVIQMNPFTYVNHTDLDPMLWEDFHRQFHELTCHELVDLSFICRKKLFNLSSKLVKCVGCRKRIQAIFFRLGRTRKYSFFPFYLANNMEGFVVHDQLGHNPRFLHDLCYGGILDNRVAQIVQQSNKTKANRCNLHNLSCQKIRSPDKWRDCFDKMNQESRNKIFRLELKVLNRGVKGFIEFSDFCSECTLRIKQVYRTFSEQIEPELREELDSSLYTYITYSGTEKAAIIKHDEKSLKELFDRIKPIMDSKFKVERHAKSVHDAQQEILNCISLMIFQRLVFVNRRYTEEILAWETLMTLSACILKENVELIINDGKVNEFCAIESNKTAKGSIKKTKEELEAEKTKKRAKKLRQREAKNLEKQKSLSSMNERKIASETIEGESNSSDAIQPDKSEAEINIVFEDEGMSGSSEIYEPSDEDVNIETVPDSLEQECTPFKENSFSMNGSVEEAKIGPTLQLAVLNETSGDCGYSSETFNDWDCSIDSDKFLEKPFQSAESVCKTNNTEGKSVNISGVKSEESMENPCKEVLCTQYLCYCQLVKSRLYNFNESNTRKTPYLSLQEQLMDSDSEYFEPISPVDMDYVDALKGRWMSLNQITPGSGSSENNVLAVTQKNHQQKGSHSPVSGSSENDVSVVTQKNKYGPHQQKGSHSKGRSTKSKYKGKNRIKV